MANCSLPHIEKRFRESDPLLADKLNEIAYNTFKEIGDSTFFTKKDNNFILNKEGTKKRIDQNNFIDKINKNLGETVVKVFNNKIVVDIFSLIDSLRTTPSYLKNISVFITPATIRSYDNVTKRIQELSLKYDKLVKEFSTTNNPDLFKEIKQIEEQILNDTQLEIIESISDIPGVSVKFDEPKIGLWNKFFEPSFNMTLSFTQRADTEKLSKILFDFAEKYSQDSFILEMESDMSKDFYEEKIPLPLGEQDTKGFTHYPQIVYNFISPISDLELSQLSISLQDSGIDAFNVNKNELKISIIPFLTENQLETLNEKQQYAEKYNQYISTVTKSWKSTLSVIGDEERFEQEIRIRKSSYHGATNEDTNEQTRQYDRSNILKKYQEVNTETEILSKELAKLKAKQIALQEKGKQLLPKDQNRFEELNKIVQPLVQNTFEVDKAFYENAKKEVEELAKQSIKKFDASVSPFDIKRPQRSSVKTLRWYNGFTEKLGDGARVNIIVNNDADADAVFDKINKDNPADPGLRRINEITNLQYPKRLIEVKSSDGIIAEIQVITKEAYLAKDGLRGFTGGDQQVKKAKETLKEIQDNLGWKIPDGLGHYFYEINRDVNVAENLKSVAFELSNLYYEAFTNPNSTLGEDFMNDVIAFKVKVDNADKTTWDEGNEGKAPTSLTQYIAENNINEEEIADKFPISDQADSVEELRVQEQAEYDAMSDPTDEVERQRIYDKYNKLITPLLEQPISPLTRQTGEQEEFKSSEDLPDSFLTLSDFEEPAYTPTTPETHPERVEPLASEPAKSIPQQWEEYNNLKDRTDLTPDEELDLAAYRAKFDMFDSPSQYEKVMSDPTSKAFVSFREKNLEELLLRFADKFGITIANIEDFQKQYFEKTGKFIPANGVANLFEKVIYVSEGNIDALTEEVAHFIIAMLPKDGELYQNLKQYISRTREYELFYDKYLAQYDGDVDKTEEEIMGKVLKNSLQDKEETVPLSVKSSVKRIINYIASLFSDDKMEYLNSLNQLKKMFFSENLAEGLDAANINYDELYQLNFEITGNESGTVLADRSKKFELGADLIIENLENTLTNIRQQAVESNQIKAVDSSSYLLSILAKKNEQDADKSKILSNMVFASVSTIRRLTGSFEQFKKLNIPKELAVEFNRENLIKLSYDDYNKSLSKLASYVNYLQSLYALSKSIESTSKLMKLDTKDLKEFKDIIYALDPSITENDEIIKAFDLLNADGVQAMMTKIESIYLENVKQILDIYMSALSTEDQKRFLNYQNETYFANTDAETIAEKNDNIIGYSTGIFNNIRNFFGNKGITPVTMQNDTFIQSVDRFVWAMEQMGKERASKEVAEVQKIENRLYQNGANAQSQEWLSEKDDKGRSTGNLITKLNFSKYSGLAAKNLKDKLRNLPFANNAQIQGLQQVAFNSPKQVFDSLGELLKNKKITQEEFDYAKNYLMAEKALYDLEHTTPNYSSTTLSGNSLDALKNFIDRNIENIREALNDKNFDWKNDEIELISNDLGDLEFALDELIVEKRALLEEKYFTVDSNKRVLLKPDGTPALDKEGNPKLNPVFQSELDFVEGLLNKYKYKIGYATDPDGNFYPDKINIDVWGDEFLFELSDSHPDAKEYTNKEYLDLEDKAKKGDALAVAKMDMVNYLKTWNKQNNLPSNFLPKGAKKDSEYLQMFGDKRFINIFGRNFDVAKIITQVVIPFAGVANTPMLFGIGAGLINPVTLGVSSMIFSYFLYNRVANQVVKFISIYGDTRGRITDSKGLKRMVVALAKSLGVYSKALQFEINKDDNIISTGEPEKTEFWLKNMFYKIFRAVDAKQANNKNKIDVIPQKYTEYIEPALRSNQYLDNFKSFIYATKEYENKSMYEGSIRAMNDLYRKREDNKGNSIGDNYLEAIYIDRYWYNKIYPNSFAMKFMRVLAAQTGFNQLTGNLNTGVKNILTGISMISANGGLLATMPAIKDATVYSLNMMFLSRGKNSRVALEQNKIQMIKKHLRSSSFGGIVDFDYSDSSLVQKLRLNNGQIVSELGESFISSVLVYKFLRDTKLIDENGKKIDIIKHLTIKDGRLSFDDKVAEKIYFNNINEIQNADDLQLEPGYVKDINLRAIVPKNLQKEALVPLEIDLYLNRTLLQNIDYFRQRSQGVYNILLKPRVATTAIGTAIFMYQHYVLPGVYTAFGRKKNDPNLEGSEEGFVITLAKALGRGVGNRFKAKLSPDSVNNIMRINNIKTKGLLEDLGTLSNVFLYFSKNKNIVTQSLLEAADSQEKAIKFAEEQDRIVAQGGERKEGPAYYAGFKGKTKEEIFKELLVEANKQQRLNQYEANNYKKVASILAMYLLLKAALKFAYPPLEENEVATYIASVSEVVSSEIFRTWFPFSEGRLGFSFNWDPMGRKANEGFISWDFTKISPIAGTVNDLAKNLYWSGSVGLYKLTGILPFSEETEAKLMDVTGGEIPLMKTRYFYNKKGYVTREVNVGEEFLKDFLIGNRLRDAMQSSELRAEKYLDIPTNELENMIYKLRNGYYKAYGRNLEDEIRPPEEE